MTNSDVLYGSAGRTLIHRVAIAAGAYAVKQIDGTTAATTAAQAILDIDGLSEQTQLVPASDGSFKLTIDNYDVGEEAIKFLNTLAKKTTGSGGGTAPPPFKNERGVDKPFAAGGSATSLCHWQSYGPLNTAGTKRLMHWGIGSVDMSSGQIIFKDGQWIKPTIIINSVAAEYELTLVSGLWVAELVDSSDALLAKVHQNYTYEREYIAVP